MHLRNGGSVLNFLSLNPGWDYSEVFFGKELSLCHSVRLEV